MATHLSFINGAAAMPTPQDFHILAIIKIRCATADRSERRAPSADSLLK
ncbi:hypothetical protein ACE1CD_29205 [Aerosakkonema sp. BLCC-F183]